ncbi:TonB-dependent receptor [Idiomarina xiamenensis]|uniref:TonB-dependent receptor n=1 Tax=Idiomarina xiamenensis 10-D-4 TaxID=740709 RepID=K2KAK6_9GAMM|nr:TonB-dependent receptor [Idiomarina xiamenensis]EKE79954.1 hypothetical protein A10D4_12258 [Idiomarina xiamenensis 10-D-4]
MKRLSFKTAILSVSVVNLLMITPTHAADEPQNSIEKITITGEKTRRSAQETAASVDVTTSLQMERENIQSLYDIINKTPNVSSMYGNRGFTIRGISNESGAENPLASIYIDGVPLPNQMTDTGPSDLWDVAQVEVLRGPQSTIQGENALAGAVVVNTNDPTMYWDGRARVQWSDPDDKRLSVAVGGPLVEQELAFRVAADKRLFKGFIYNPTRDEYIDEVNSLLLRGKLLWTPKALDGLRVLFNYTRDKRDGPYMYSYNHLNESDKINTSNRDTSSDALTEMLSLNVDYQLDEQWLLSSATSYSRPDVQRVYDIDLSPADNNYGFQDNHYKVFTQEFRANYQGQALNALMGVYLSRHDNHAALATRSNIETPIPTIAGVLQGYGLDSDTATAIAVNYGQALPQIPVDYQSLNDSTSENQALFVDVDYQFNDAWTLLAGFRYDHQQYSFASDVDSDFAGTLPDPTFFGSEGSQLYQLIGGINNAVLGLVAQASGSNPETEISTDTFLPKFGVRYTFDDDKSLTATYQKAYRSGGSSLNIARSEVVAYEPEYTDNYELAWRQLLPSVDGVFNANVYYVDWKDKQVVANFGLNSYDTHTVNAGNAHLYGAEATFKQQLNNDISWYLSYGYSRTQFDHFDTVVDGSITSYAGEEFTFAPNHTASAGVNVYITDQVSWNVNASYRSEVYTAIGANRTEESSRTIVNTRLAYDSQNWSAYLFSNNLFDNSYIQYRFSDGVNAITSAPRVVGVGVEARW